MALRDEPDLPLGVGDHEIAFAGFAGVVHAKDFIDIGWVEMAVIDWMRVGLARAFEGVDFNVEFGIDVHSRENANAVPAPIGKTRR